MKRLLKYKQLALKYILLLSIFSLWAVSSGSIVLAAATNTTCTLNSSSPNYVSQCCDTSSNITTNASTCLFAKYINPGVALLSATVGLVVVIAVIIGSIEYIGSGGDPQELRQAGNTL